MKSRRESSLPVSTLGLEARELYGSGEMCCSEAVLTVLNNEFDGGLSPELAVALSKGFCGGIGDAGCVCGALSGAVIGLGLILCKDGFPADEELVCKVSKELYDRFSARHGSLCCRILSRDRDPESESKGPCLDYVDSAAALGADLILDHATLVEDDEHNSCRSMFLADKETAVLSVS